MVLKTYPPVYQRLLEGVLWKYERVSHDGMGSNEQESRGIAPGGW